VFTDRFISKPILVSGLRAAIERAVIAPSANVIPFSRTA